MPGGALPIPSFSVGTDVRVCAPCQIRTPDMGQVRTRRRRASTLDARTLPLRGRGDLHAGKPGPIEGRLHEA